MITQIVKYALEEIINEAITPEAREAIYATVKLMALSGNEEANELLDSYPLNRSNTVRERGSILLDKAMIAANERLTESQELIEYLDSIA